MAVAWRPGGAFPHRSLVRIPFCVQSELSHFSPISSFPASLPPLRWTSFSRSSRMAIVFLYVSCAIFALSASLALSISCAIARSLCTLCPTLPTLSLSPSPFPSSSSFPSVFLVSRFLPKRNGSPTHTHTHTRTLDAHKIDPMKGKKENETEKGRTRENWNWKRGEGEGREGKKANARVLGGLGRWNWVPARGCGWGPATFCITTALPSRAFSHRVHSSLSPKLHRASANAKTLHHHFGLKQKRKGGNQKMNKNNWLNKSAEHCERKEREEEYALQRYSTPPSRNREERLEKRESAQWG